MSYLYFQKMSPCLNRSNLWKCLLIIGLVLPGCASQPAAEKSSTAAQERMIVKSRAETEELNRKLAFAANRSILTIENAAQDYRVGPGDVLEISVFQVPDLNTQVRVNGQGAIVLALIGPVVAGARTTAEIEKAIRSKLAASYLHDPQVSVFVHEFRSQQLTILGAVKKPDVYVIKRSHTVLEAVSIAGGLTQQASRKIHVQAIKVDDEGRRYPENFIVDLNQMVENNDQRFNITLNGGDSIYVPEAGVIFVEGAVKKPGSYPVKGQTNVLKAIALAGGTEYARENSIQIFRQIDSENQILEIDLESVRENTQEDILLEDGDIVVVRPAKFKRGLIRAWREFTGVFRFRPI